MLKIRCQRIGRIHCPVFRIIVVESHKRNSTIPIDILGNYYPQKKTDKLIEKVNLNKEKLNKWISNGAQVSKRILKIIQSYER